MSKIEAVIFDVGGVLHASNTALNDDLSRELDVSDDTLQSIRANELSLLGLGAIDETEFWQQVHDHYDVRLVATDENLLGRAFAEQLKPHTSMLELVKELRENGMKLAILSNTIEPHAKALQAAGIYDGFDYVLLSHELGMRKPDRAIYERALEILQTKPEATVFVDDDPRNIEAAEKLGFHGVTYSEANEVIEKIRALIAGEEAER